MRSGPFMPLDGSANVDEEGHHMVAKMPYTLLEGTFFLASHNQAMFVLVALVSGGLGLV